MKKIVKWGLMALVMLCSVNVFAQSAADKIVGVYQVEEEGRQSKVRFTKCDDGTYQGQIIWLSEPNNPDGTRKMDVNNPDPKKRTTPSVVGDATAITSRSIAPARTQPKLWSVWLPEISLLPGTERSIASASPNSDVKPSSTCENLAVWRSVSE